MRLFAAALLLASSMLHAAPPSQAQIDQLLEITHARDTITSMLSQIENSQRQMVQQATAGRAYSEQQSRALDAVLNTSLQTLSQLLSWEELQPLYRDLYVQTFDAEEVQAMIDFYTTSAGQSMVRKMPLLMNNAMQAVQARIIPMLQELQRAIEAEQAGHGHQH